MKIHLGSKLGIEIHISSRELECDTGKSFSEVLILALTNSKYDKRLSIEFTSSVNENSKLRTWENMLCT